MLYTSNLICANNGKKYSWSYALYASYGDLDLSCPSKISLGIIKDFMSFPVTIPLRSHMRALIQTAFDQVSSTSAASNKNLSSFSSKLMADPDETLVSLKTFLQLLQSSVFKDYMKISLPFGVNDPNPWLYTYEEAFYCPALLRSLKNRRREARNNVEVTTFRSLIVTRWMKIGLLLWRRFLNRRQRFRVLTMWCGARIRFDVMSRSFDKWRKFAIADHCAREAQRIIRGFIGRGRKRVTRLLLRQSIKLQSVARQASQRRKYGRSFQQRYWAATTIQRHYRGLLARQHVCNLVMEAYEMGKRQLEADKRNFEMMRRYSKNVFRVRP